MFKIKINGKCVSVPSHFSIHRACQSIGVYVPTLCAHPRLPAAGTCRLCLVELKNGKLVPACASPVEEDMEISTDSTEVKKSIRSNLALLKSHHPKLCMTCEANGSCEVSLGFY